MKKLLATIAAATCLASGAWAKTIDLSTVSSNTTANDGDVATGALGGNRKISIAAGATVTLSDAAINVTGVDSESCKFAGITCLGDATIILDGENSVKGFYKDYPGIYVPLGSTLTIEGSGSLKAGGGGRAAGIGGGYNIDCGSIVINGGTITAEGGSNSAGIGGGYSGTYFPDRDVAFGDITINGGTVTANGGASGAGIGGGYGQYRTGGGIVVAGGAVNATGGSNGAGIGSGEGADDRTMKILIKGGSVTAKGGGGAAGIGSGGQFSRCGDIVISAGTVVANGGADTHYYSGAGIGSGGSATCGDIEITGGTVTASGGMYATAHPGAGIGAGVSGRSGRVVICGGDVTAYGHSNSELTSSAGIGVCCGGDCAGIIITGGDVKATGGTHAAGIGGCWHGDETGDIVIEAGKAPHIVATRGENWGYSPISQSGAGARLVISAGLADKTVGQTRTIEWNGDLGYIDRDIVVGDGKVLFDTAVGKWKLSIADGATVTISNATVSGVNNSAYKYAGITCEGNATIILEGANVVKGWYKDYPGIYVPPGKKLTIKGDGSLTASSSGRGAGIGGGYMMDCGQIYIEGGSVTATGGDYAAGIGSGWNATCGNIMIKPGITHVTATHGTNGVKPIGNGYGGASAGYNAYGLSVKTVGATLYISSGTISGPDEISGAGETVLQDGDILTGEITGKRKMSIAAGATVTISDVTLDGLTEGGYSNTDWAGITCLGDATIILEGGNYVAGYNQYRPGIHVPVGSTLTIKGGGSLTAEGAERAAGIGGAWKLACGNVVIESGHVEAHGGSDAAGIGGGFMGACGDIAIEGGYVWATGGKDAAGIGSGSFSSCENITITGGEVAASGGSSAAGIGGGNGGEIGSIYIGEGIVRVAATRGANAKYHIGRYSGDNPGDVTMAENLDDTLVDNGATRIVAPLVMVTFDAQGGTVSPATRKVVKGSYIGELPVPVKAGYTFQGWFSSTTFDSIYQIISTDVVNADITLYAKWKVKKHMVTFNANGGTGGWAMNMEYGATITPPTVTREGYTFAGWSPAVDTTVPDKDVTYTAQWTKNGGGDTPCYEMLVEDDITAPYAAPKAVKLYGAVYDGCDVAGVVELKLGKVNAKKGIGKVSGTVTTIDGKKHSAKAVAISDIDGVSPKSVSLDVKDLGAMELVIGGEKFAGSLGDWHVQSTAVGGAWTGTNVSVTVNVDDLSMFSGTVLTNLLPSSEKATVNGAKWVFAKAAGVKWAKPKKGAELPEIYDETSGKGLYIDTSGDKTNLSGLKLSYAPKKGTFKGTFKVYVLEGTGKSLKLKKYSVKVSGFVVDGVGHGTATCKKPELSWTVEVGN